MSEISVQATSAKKTLQEIAAQAKKLADGLQNAAPSDQNAAPNKSIEYLLSVSNALNDFASECDTVVKPFSGSPPEDEPGM